MSTGRLGSLLLAAAAALAAAPEQTPPASGRLVWHETYDDTHESPIGHAANHAEYRIVEDREIGGSIRTLSRTVSWSSEGETVQPGLIMIPRGQATREKRDYIVSCAGGGSVELGTDYPSTQRGVRELEARRTRCYRSHPSDQWGVFGGTEPLTWGVPGVSIAPMDLEKLGADCELTRTRTEHSFGTRTLVRHVWISHLEAVVEIRAADAAALKKFVPEPGRWLAFTVRSNVPTLFRFELDGVSHYAGFATNANVDDDFFAQRPVIGHLRGRYQNEDPDFIFDPLGYEELAAWKWNGWTSVETTRPSTVATVFVTAMDYAAWGRLRVLAKGDCHDRFEPAEVRMDGRRRGFLVLPIDENDDLMADALPAYAGDPGRDDEQGYVDRDFPEDAKRGDGLTAFEEYRGFEVRGPSCYEPLKDAHRRTSPLRRDLFVNATHAVLAAALGKFGDVADLDTQQICARHYIDDKTRVINTTLQSAGQRRFHGYVITQDVPQHGLLLENARLDEDETTGGMSLIGPPKNVDAVRIDLLKLLQGPHGGNARIVHTVTHELGHALGLKHHGDGNLIGPIALLDQISCRYGMREGSVDGRTACEVTGVAVRQGENSGDEYCPMKYVFWLWYVPPGGKLETAGSVEFFAPRANGSWERVQRPAYRLTGALKRYEWAEDSFGLASFCNSPKGTGINALPGDRNHAGDSTRICAKQLQVSDAR